jgi:hypothetical protein
MECGFDARRSLKDSFRCLPVLILLNETQRVREGDVVLFGYWCEWPGPSTIRRPG